MAKFLFIVDLQKEFVKNWRGKQIYKKALQYIESEKNKYIYIYAAVYMQNMEEFKNMHDKLGWTDCQSISRLEFPCDKVIYHSGYSIPVYPEFNKNDEIDVIGFDTDACVLSACFHLFDMDCNLRILTDYIYSSGGDDYHKAGLRIMKRQFGNCVI